MPTLTDVDIWPLLGVRISLSDLELAGIDDRTALDLGRLAARGIHGMTLPFATPWSRGSDLEVARNLYRYHSGLRTTVRPEEWSLDFAARLDHTLIGVQTLVAKDFPTTRTAESMSWLGRDWQGRGIGTLQRVAILTFAFEGLGAEVVTTSAWADNAASNAVTRKLGYRPNGEEVLEREGRAAVLKHYRLDRTGWDRRPEEFRQVVQIEGLEPIRAWLGLDQPRP
ncbi:GNAT family protein [Amnibacterium sp. CER49]|uniref:GNAT family N-acetyltransferase n=1 Tax=Amnibacterium sp. CER49 TaxID=3039161 RepID=UPI00244D40E1|nr:GNAT family protein [Amnibacterium sp. CER49]MDH2445320.1 GNAT family protein [Amnibacterium sp. CER49]